MGDDGVGGVALGALEEVGQGVGGDHPVFQGEAPDHQGFEQVGGSGSWE